MQVCEIFYSLQGESSYAGYPFVFVRTSGCPLRCLYCDSVFARGAGQFRSVSEVLAAVRAYGFHPVLITGGEPLLQPDLNDLIGPLAEEGRTVLVETGGSLSLAGLDPRVVKILDVKCPGSGEADKNHWPNLSLLNRRDEVKFVLCQREDYLFACRTTAEYNLTDCCRVLFSAAHGYLNPRDLAAWILQDGLPVRLQVQLHKILWPEIERGV